MPTEMTLKVSSGKATPEPFGPREPMEMLAVLESKCKEDPLGSAYGWAKEVWIISLFSSPSCTTPATVRLRPTLGITLSMT